MVAGEKKLFWYEKNCVTFGMTGTGIINKVGSQHVKGSEPVTEFPHSVPALISSAWDAICF